MGETAVCLTPKANRTGSCTGSHSHSLGQPHLMEETEAQGREMTGPMSQSLVVLGQGALTPLGHQDSTPFLDNISKSRSNSYSLE